LQHRFGDIVVSIRSVVSAYQRSPTKLNVVFETGQFSTILAMVSAGMGISVVPETAIESIKVAGSFRWPIAARSAASAWCDAQSFSNARRSRIARALIAKRE
jgi:DNA-binding transcriptional LysR family regulator